MKKRLISILLSVLMIASLFTGIGVTAHAETVAYNTMTYRMQSGDYVLRICQRLGLNYYICKPAIMKLNNITDNQWRFLPVGKLLTLPATDADAVVVNTGKGSTITAAPATTAVASTIAAATPKASTTTTSASASGDIIWWWIVPYELRNGQTITDAMNSLGVSFSQYARTIQLINQIKNWGAARTDTSILLPTVYPPATGYSRVTIYKHIMREGETPASVVAARGLNYNNIKPMLEIVNDMYDSLADIMTGQPFYYPIASDGKVMGKDRTDGLYGLYSGLSSANGTVEFYVDGQRVYEAKAGSTVKYVLKPAKDQAVKSVTLKFANGQADMLLTGDSFTMPSTDVTLDAAFQSGHKITVKSNYEGKAVARVDGISVSGAAKGANVMVASTDSSLAIEELYVNYKTFTGDKREAVTNIDQGFVMPDYDVVIEAVLKPVPTYAFFVDDEIANGSFSLQVDGAKVTRAARGAEVKIVAEPNKGYAISGIEVLRHGTTDKINVFNNTFTMPNCDVDVKVTFDLSAGNRILVNPVQGGQFWATVGAAGPKSSAVTEANTNVKVYINWKKDDDASGYAASTVADDYIVTRTTDGLRVKVEMDGGVACFRMPAGGVTITGGVVAGAHTYKLRVILDGTDLTDNKILSVYAKGDKATERSEFPNTAAVQTTVGEIIAISYNGGESISLSSIEVWDSADSAKLAEESNQARLTGSFQMPDADVVIHANFVAATVKLAAKDVKVTGSGTYGMIDKDGNSVDGVKPGEPFSITLSPSQGYVFDTNPADGKARLVVTRKDNKGELVATITGPNANGEYTASFDAMPDCGVNVEITFDKMAYVLNVTTVNEDGSALTGGGFLKFTVGGKDVVIENNSTTINAYLNDSVSFALTEAGASKYSFVRSEINGVISKNTAFKISGDLAKIQNIPVVIVLKAKELSVQNNPIKLKATINDSKRGTAGFTITQASPYYQRPVDPTALVTEAYAGDTVAIIPQAMTAAMYYTDSEHMSVNLGGGAYIQPDGPVDIGGQQAYTFEMPSTGYKAIYVNFVPVEYMLTINTDPADAAKGLFRVTYSDGATNNDVLLGTSFKDAAYGSTIKVVLTDAGKKAGVHIDSLTVNPAPESATEPKAITGGFQFTMPAGDTNVTVVLRDKNNLDTDVPRGETPPVEEPVQLPTSTDGGLNLQYSYENGTLITDSKPTSGETVKVDVTSTLNPGEMIDGPIEIKDSDGTVIATVEDGGTFVVPYSEKTPLTASANVVKKQYKVKIDVANAPETYTIKVDGQAVTAGTILSPNKEYGTSMTIEVTGSRDIDSVDNLNGSASAKTFTGTLEPADSVENGATVDVTIHFKTTMLSLAGTEVEFYTSSDFSGSPVTQAGDGDTVYVKGVPSDHTKYATEIEVKVGSDTSTVADGAAVKVTDAVTASIKSTADKKVSVNIVSKYTDGSDATDRVEVTGNTTDLVNGATLNLTGKTGATIAVTPETGASFSGSTLTIDTSAVDNGATVNVEVEVTKPSFQLKDGSLANNATTEYFYDAEMKKPVDSSLKVTEGEQIYIKATPGDDAQYVTGVAIYGSTLTKQSSGAYGPYTITKDMTYKPAVDTADKVITLQFDFKDGAQSEVEVRFNGAAQVDWATSGVSNVTKSGERKISLITLDIVASSTKEFKVVSSTNGSASLVGTPPKQATLSPNWADLENGDTLTYTVYVG